MLDRRVLSDLAGGEINIPAVRTSVAVSALPGLPPPESWPTAPYPLVGPQRRPRSVGLRITNISCMSDSGNHGKRGRRCRHPPGEEAGLRSQQNVIGRVVEGVALELEKEHILEEA